LHPISGRNRRDDLQTNVYKRLLSISETKTTKKETYFKV